MQIDAIESGNNDKIPLICYCRVHFMIQQSSHQNPTLQAAIYDIQQHKIKIKRIQHKESIYRENWSLLQLHAGQNYKKHIKTQGKTIQPEMSGPGGRERPSGFGKIGGRARGTQRQDEVWELHCHYQCRWQTELNRPVALPLFYPSLSVSLSLCLSL